jgi:Skp family chaperone for outer membrane proteins
MVFIGCNGGGSGGGGSSGGRVAVVDLNKIATDIGQRSKIQEAGQVRERNLQISVRILQRDVQAKLVALAKEIGDRPKAVDPAKPTEAEDKLIKEWIGKMRNLEQARLKASNDIRQAYNKQRQANQNALNAEIAKIRDRIRPLAKRIAGDKGLDIVMVSSSVLVSAESVDITNAVFKEVNELLKAGNFPTVTIPEPMPIPTVPQTTTAPAGGTTPKKGGTTTTP